MNSKVIGGWLAVVIAVVIVVILIVRMEHSIGGQTAQTPAQILTVRADDHVKGDHDNPAITIIEYSDFQCPACATAYTYFTDIDTVFPKDVRFVYRHFPLTLIHKNATAAARAAEAAAVQGQFRAMHDRLFTTQDQWSDKLDAEEIFANYAEELGMDRAQFIADYKSDAVKERVKRDARDARALKLSGTPTIFINGQQARLPRTKEAFYAALRERLTREGIDNTQQQ